jgi:Ran GTPase-activating protein (RanGAP) involved in mRNA processing and transport
LPRFSNNGLTKSQIDQLINIVSADSCPILNLFIDWNPIYTEKYTGGYPNENDSSLFY